MTQIGKNIKKIRTVKGLSQQAFADIFNLTRGNISSYEELRAEPKLDVLVRIAKYFGIPLAEFIEKELSVNELLHYNTEFVLETEKMKLAQQFTKIPYVSILYINDYIENYQDDLFIQQLPYLILPGNPKIKLLAVEVDNQEALPTGFNYHTGDILIYEIVTKENAHRILNRLGILINKEGIKSGIFIENEDKVILALNEWVNYPFELESGNQYWVLKASYTQAFKKQP